MPSEKPSQPTLKLFDFMKWSIGGWFSVSQASQNGFNGWSVPGRGPDKVACNAPLVIDEDGCGQCPDLEDPAHGPLGVEKHWEM
jgi:hypothetical protein